MAVAREFREDQSCEVVSLVIRLVLSLPIIHQLAKLSFSKEISAIPEDER
jgi:hypothetical protein